MKLLALTVLHWQTPDKGIASCTYRTLTIGRMRHDKTLGSNAACAGTRIRATSINASIVGRAISVDHAFCTAIWRGAEIAGDAGTRRLIAVGLALRVRTTW